MMASTRGGRPRAHERAAARTAATTLDASWPLAHCSGVVRREGRGWTSRAGGWGGGGGCGWGRIGGGVGRLHLAQWWNMQGGICKVCCRLGALRRRSGWTGAGACSSGVAGKRRRLPRGFKQAPRAPAADSSRRVPEEARWLKGRSSAHQICSVLGLSSAAPTTAAPGICDRRSRGRGCRHISGPRTRLAPHAQLRRGSRRARVRAPRAAQGLAAV